MLQVLKGRFYDDKFTRTMLEPDKWELKVHLVRRTGKWPGHSDLVLCAAIPNSGRVTGRRDISMNSESVLSMKSQLK